MPGSRFLDSSGLIDLVRDEREDDEHLPFAADEVRISVIAWAEVLTGAQITEQSDRERRRLQLIQDAVTLVAVTARIAERYAVIAGQLRRIGRRIPTNDIWIAATALEYDLPLDARDAHFAFVDGLTLA